MSPASQASDDLAQYGVNEVHAASLPRLAAYTPAAWARSILELSGASDGSAIVAAATDRGNEVLAHAGALSEQPVAANCLSFSRAEFGSLTLTRYRWAGTLLEDAELQGRPALITVVADAAPDVPLDAPVTLTKTEWEPTLDDRRSSSRCRRANRVLPVPRHSEKRASSSAEVAASAAQTGSRRSKSSPGS